MRTCDYALLIAERLEDDHGVAGFRHSFGPGTSYEVRDRRRQSLVKKWFGQEIAVPFDQYVYIDEDGVDVSATHRNNPGFP